MTLARAGSSYLGRGEVFDGSIADFSRYADQNDRDDEALLKAVQSGRLIAVGAL